VTQVVDAFCGALMISELSALALVRHVLIKGWLAIVLVKRMLKNLLNFEFDLLNAA
jgi:hypothetical protein